MLQTIKVLDKKIYDISLPLNIRTKVFPGDTPLQYNFLHHVETGDSVTLSDFTCTTHIGTHADSPFHYLEGEQTIGELDLDLFIGTCHVVRVNPMVTTPIMPDELPEINVFPQRILFCTTTENKYNEWTNNYRTPSIQLIDFLHKKGVKLMGIDTPSVDAVNTNDAPIHKRIFNTGMVILENLYLNEVPEGEYELIALPLKFTELEASPVRAILRTL